jgi:hypothetical protein
MKIVHSLYKNNLTLLFFFSFLKVGDKDSSKEEKMQEILQPSLEEVSFEI